MSKGQKPPGKRNRRKGADFTSGEVINRDRAPLGLARPGRPFLEIPVVIFAHPAGGVPFKPVVERFEHALELTARTIAAYVEATQDRALTPEIHEALEGMAELDDRRYGKAISSITNFKSTDAHRQSMRETADQAVRHDRHIAALNYAFYVLAVLQKGKAVAEIQSYEGSRFAHDNISANQNPSDAVLLRTFLPSVLKNVDNRSVSYIKKGLSKRDALREHSDIELGELATMAYRTVFNPVWIYSDSGAFWDLFDLAVFAGRAALGFREMMDKDMIDTYRSLLCGGEDLYHDIKFRPARAHLATTVRGMWRATPALVTSTRYQGQLLDP